MKIVIKYSCYQCGLKKIDLAVPSREDEDVVFWVEHIVGQHIKDDHLKRSPKCQAKTVQDLMIPVEGTEKVGGSVKQ